MAYLWLLQIDEKNLRCHLNTNRKLVNLLNTKDLKTFKFYFIHRASECLSGDRYIFIYLDYFIFLDTYILGFIL